MYRTVFAPSISDVDEAAWQAIVGNDYPFVRHAFLKALEDTGAVGDDSGWLAQHILVYHGDKLVAVAPSYLKTHSYGEYVFDWAWADAFHRYGREYYPKLITAIPFTPITGPRICIAEGEHEADIHSSIIQAVRAATAAHEFSSWHLLFPTKAVSDALKDEAMQRSAVHFQWRNEGYTSFEDFLAEFSSRKRKNLRKEREKVRAADIEFEVLSGHEISEAMWDDYYLFYQITYARRSGHGGYLDRAFFSALSAIMPEHLVLVMAKRHGDYIAGALNFRGKDTLYGRYWGCKADFDFLHFETCYYQGIAYCIREGLQRFDPGVQGEHKLQRGFRPTYTFSNHIIAEPAFEAAIADFLEREKPQVEAYFEEACSYLPFRAPEPAPRAPD
ncbi:GNAT family N-acetyltransferase [Allohahella marinimesophila]|uniref:GNAT family N-acetyltransferase n=1 Tax=Allohahella marinimesophila TaxID=1054972 RepID=A0ABP7P971_9GAMM